LELEDRKIEVHGEAVRSEKALTPQDPESGSAQMGGGGGGGVASRKVDD